MRWYLGGMRGIGWILFFALFVLAFGCGRPEEGTSQQTSAGAGKTAPPLRGPIYVKPPPAEPATVPVIGAEGERVTVFYGTNRARFHPDWKHYAAYFWLSGLLFFTAVLLPLILRWMLRTELRWIARVVAIAAWGGFLASTALQAHATLLGTGFARRIGFVYGSDPGARDDIGERGFSLGTCVVSVPTGHATGEIERPSLWKGEFVEDPARHMMVLEIHPKADADFLGELRAAVERSNARDAFVFVHGYNQTFERAALRTAQIAHDIGFRGAPILFSWPSKGSVQSYLTDDKNADWSARHLLNFLRFIHDRSGADRVHLVAHSMGSKIVSRALELFAAEQGDRAHIFGEIVFAAPDVDARHFAENIVPAARRAGDRVTLYACSSDDALKASAALREGSPRAGESGENLLVVEGLDTIDVSTVAVGHSYIGRNGKVLNDVRALLRYCAQLSDRKYLVEGWKEGLRYWRIDALFD